MERLQQFQMSSVQGPRLAAIQETTEDCGLIHFHLTGLPDVVLVQYAHMQSAQSFAGFTDPSTDLLVQRTVAGDGAAEVFKVLHSF